MTAGSGINCETMARRLFPLSEQVSRMLSYLELLIVARKIGIREFERRAKMSAGTLARLFSGKITLKFQTMLDMLEVLDVPPDAFFSVVFSSDEVNPDRADELLRRVQSLSFPTAPPAAVFSKREFRQMIEEVVTERLLALDLATGAKPAPKTEPQRTRRPSKPRRPSPRKPTKPKT